MVRVYCRTAFVCDGEHPDDAPETVSFDLPHRLAQAQATKAGWAEQDHFHYCPGCSALAKAS